jgi:hypothetical protein
MKRKNSKIEKPTPVELPPPPLLEPDHPMSEQERRELAYEHRGEVDEAFEPVPIEPRIVQNQPALVDPAWWAFVKVFHEDKANASMHCAVVRYSPLTFRLAEALNEYMPLDPYVQSVLGDVGAYEEDTGR